MPSQFPLRWVAFGIFTLATSLNYLDRQLLAALAPQIRAEFSLTNADYGLLLSAFSIAYALSSPAAGMMIDRIGLNRGISISVALWSLCGVATGLAGGFPALLAVRAGLGVAESGGIPASGKANALYMPPQERSLGTALNQIGLSLGAAGAPLVGTWIALQEGWGWRSAFVVAGVAGLLWIPLWLVTAGRIPPAGLEAQGSALKVSDVIADRRLWSLVIANVLAMILFSLWTNWTTLYLVEARGLSLTDANRNFAWIPPVCANVGGLVGGWLAFRAIRQGMAAQAARTRVCFWAAIVLLLTGTIPYMPTAGLATAGICLSFFCTLSMSVNIYALPLDIFGPANAAMAISTLTFAFGLMQTVISPAIGALIDRYGFEPVCLAGALMPLAAVWFLKRAGSQATS